MAGHEQALQTQQPNMAIQEAIANVLMLFKEASTCTRKSKLENKNEHVDRKFIRLQPAHETFFFSKKIRSTRNVFRPMYFVIVSSPNRHSPPPPSRSHCLQKERLGPPVLAHCDL